MIFVILTLHELFHQCRHTDSLDRITFIDPVYTAPPSDTKPAALWQQPETFPVKFLIWTEDLRLQFENLQTDSQHFIGNQNKPQDQYQWLIGVLRTFQIEVCCYFSDTESLLIKFQFRVSTPDDLSLSGSDVSMLALALSILRPDLYVRPGSWAETGFLSWDRVPELRPGSPQV